MMVLSVDVKAMNATTSIIFMIPSYSDITFGSL